MRPLPDLAAEADMIERGRRSALAQARREAIETLRDAYTMIQTADWDSLAAHAAAAREASDRLVTLAAMWEEL